MQNTATKYRVLALTESASLREDLLSLPTYSLSLMTWQQLGVPRDWRFKVSKDYSPKGCPKPIVAVDGAADTF